MKKITLPLLILIIGAILSGCGMSSQGKIYFTSNEWSGGKTAQDNLGTCVYDDGRVKKLYRNYIAPSVSLDGSKLIATINFDRRVAVVDFKNNSVKEYTIANNTIMGYNWFPGNKKVAYAGSDRTNIKTTVWNVCTFDLETEKIEKITSYTEINHTIRSIALSPDAKYIVYSFQLGQEAGTGQVVKIINIETKEEEELPFNANSLCWSPDGKTIAMQGIYKKEYGSRIIIYDIKSKTYKKLDKPGGDKAYMWESDLAYSPDGKKIAFVRNENSGMRTLCVMNADGTNRQKIHSSRYIASVSWSK